MKNYPKEAIVMEIEEGDEVVTPEIMEEIRLRGV